MWQYCNLNIRGDILVCQVVLWSRILVYPAVVLLRSTNGASLTWRALPAAGTWSVTSMGRPWYVFLLLAFPPAILLIAFMRTSRKGRSRKLHPLMILGVLYVLFSFILAWTDYLSH